MTAVREPTPIFIDASSSGPENLYGITVDPRGTKRFDDAIAVTPLPSTHELYRVDVFAADASPMYEDETVIEQGMQDLRALTPSDERRNTKEQRSPISTEFAAAVHFAENRKSLSALVISFTIGDRQPICDFDLTYGRVEIVKNYPSADFGNMCHNEAQFSRYCRAATFILGDLAQADVSMQSLYRALLMAPSSELDRGIVINQAFMVAANHVAAAVLRANGRPAIYHPARFESPPVVFPPVQLVSSSDSTPNLLDAYSKVTSPLRRFEHLVMHGQTSRFNQGNPPTERDLRILTELTTHLQDRYVSRHKSDIAKVS